jgi:hypothetical protein
LATAAVQEFDTMQVTAMTELEEGREQLARQLDEYETLMDVSKKRLEEESAQLAKRAQVWSQPPLPPRSRTGVHVLWVVELPHGRMRFGSLRGEPPWSDSFLELMVLRLWSVVTRKRSGTEGERGGVVGMSRRWKGNRRS